jgi:hypothetical protein
MKDDCQPAALHWGSNGSGGHNDYSRANVSADGAGKDVVVGSIAISGFITVPAGHQGKVTLSCWAPQPAHADNLDIWAIQLDSIS